MSSSPTSSNSKLTMRLVIDPKNEKVLFAETTKPVVDFIFYMLTLPLGTVVKLLGNNNMVGSIENVYQSVQDLDQIYMYPRQSKDHLLNPTASISSNEFCNLFPTKDDDDDNPSISDFLLVNDELDAEEEHEEDKDDEDEDEYEGEGNDREDEKGNNKDVKEEKEGDYEDEEEEDNYEDEDEEEEEEEGLGFYECPNRCSNKVTNDITKICGRCNIAMNRGIELYFKDDVEENISIHDGFVKNNVTFLVMDDLVIQPITSLIEVVNKFNLSKIGDLQDMVVELGLVEGIELLKASLQSKKVLTSVFIKNKKEY